MELFRLGKKAKSQNPSNQRTEIPQPVKTNYIMPVDDDLTEEDLNKKPNSVRTHRRIAHVPKFTLPVKRIKEPTITPKVVNKSEPESLPILKQYSSRKPCKVRTLDDTKGRRTYSKYANPERNLYRKNVSRSRTPAQKRKAGNDGKDVKNKKPKDDIVKIMLRGKRSRRSKKSAEN